MRKPTLRFKGFNGDWEDKPLNEVALINPKADIPKTFEYVDLESVVGTTMISHREEHKETAPSRAQRLAKNGDIFYQTVRPYQKNNYHFCKSANNYVFSTGYAQLRPSINGSFLFVALQNDDFVSEVLLNCTGTSYPAINSNELGKLMISYPLDNAEQKAIGSFFTELDALIEGKRAKLDKLKKLKLAYLGKMFPKKGSRVPEVRFKGFTGDWDERKLADYLSICPLVNSDNRYSAKDVLSVSGEFGVVNQIEFQGRSFAGASLLKYRVSETGTVIYTKSPLKANPYGIIKANKGPTGIVSVLYAVYIPNDNADADFVQVYFDDLYRLNSYLRTLVNKGAKNTLLISDEEALNGYVVFPSRPEQQKIAAFFNHLDNLIGLQQQELDKLSNIKSACLSKMFA